MKRYVIACALALWATFGAVAADPYRLGAEDVVSLRVLAWNDRTAAFEQMDALAGEYIVSADGTVSLPFVGLLDASGTTVDELGARIATGLKMATGLFQLPQVWLQIVTYRPFYVVGDVASPGAFAWRPGLTASKALALSGGLYRGRRDAIDDTSETRQVSSLRGVQVDLVRLRARQARLEAEQSRAQEISFPEALRHPDGPGAVERIKTEEHAIFAIRREAQARSVESMRALIGLYEIELGALEGKLRGMSKSLEAARDRAEKMRVLADRGTIVNSQMINAERTLAEMSAEELDLNTAMFRARQNIGETERDLLQATDQRRHEILTQLQETRHRTELATKREAMFMNLAATSGVTAIDGPVETVMRVRRDSGDGVRVMTLGLDDVIQPGDVFEVSLDLALTGQ